MATGSPFLNLEELASFEVTSEDTRHPLEYSLLDNGQRWLAASEGPQRIRVSFDAPQTISRIVLTFQEYDHARTQEFALFWQGSAREEWQEFRRQQFNFSPPATTREHEDYTVDLRDVTGLELRVRPSLDGRGRASLTYLALG